MKLLSIKILMGNLLGALLFLMLSCSTTVDYAKKYPNMVANIGPYAVGTIEAQLDTFFSSKVKTTEVVVFFYPRLNSVALEFKYELITYRQLWDEENRKAFAAALELYKKDYEERKLIKRPKRTRAVYGKMQGRNEWETFKFAKNRIAYPAINLGYRFKKDVPYFTVLMQSALESDDSLENTNRLESPQITMYFTRAQADDLVKYFDQSFLLGTLETLRDYIPEEARGFLGLDWSIFRRRSNSNQPVVGDSYGEDEEDGEDEGEQ